MTKALISDVPRIVSIDVNDVMQRYEPFVFMMFGMNDVQ
jgi:hypothetical protein